MLLPRTLRSPSTRWPRHPMTRRFTAASRSVCKMISYPLWPILTTGRVSTPRCSPIRVSRWRPRIRSSTYRKRMAFGGRLRGISTTCRRLNSALRAFAIRAPNSTSASSVNSRSGRKTRYRSSSTRSSAVAKMSRTSAPGREVPEHGPEGEVQGDRDHRDRGDERHAETGSAAPLPSSKRDHGRVHEREEPEKREARDDGDRLDREEDEDAGNHERNGDGRGGHLSSSDPREHAGQEAVPGHAERGLDRRGEVRIQRSVHRDDPDQQDGTPHVWLVRLAQEVPDAHEDHVLGAADARGAVRPTRERGRPHIPEDRDEEPRVDQEGERQRNEHAPRDAALRMLHLVRQLGDDLETLERDEEHAGPQHEFEGRERVY